MCMCNNFLVISYLSANKIPKTCLQVQSFEYKFIITCTVQTNKQSPSLIPSSPSLPVCLSLKPYLNVELSKVELKPILKVDYAKMKKLLAPLLMIQLFDSIHYRNTNITMVTTTTTINSYDKTLSC